ncbi:uncharacterized protein LOC125777444 [Bactrocera dorsalis]|uniref:Uncharacterized protein LOC125777444 n=1 Tax=Bactrocera dorsalis TaxID=27457 RepID=A0ABM3JGH5_BACDO|nr:uncharacterized protein LOC125777444 [Bactrocera dorsalis]
MYEIANGTRSTRFEWSLMRVGTELRTHEQGVRFAEENGLIPSEQMCPVHKVPKTIRKGDKFGYCGEAVVIYQLDHQHEQGKIGGPGKIVQIDESKFGRRKYNKGRRVEEHWVLGMVEDGSEDIRLEVSPDNLRTADILILLIQKHVAEGSIVRTHCWQAYDALPNFGYVHQKVNHSDDTNPFGSEGGVHTQRIESQWSVVKRFFYEANYNHTANFADVIVEYMWRRTIQKQEKDPFVSLIDAIKYVHIVEELKVTGYWAW